jgi:hypothetical protein
MNKRLTHIRAYQQDQARLNELARELALIQKARVTTPEVIKRTLNIPNLKDVLKTDAEAKRRIRV